jgi:HSP20 family molecular chaperone IbpA
MPLNGNPGSEVVTGLWFNEREALSLLREVTNRSPYHMSVVEDGDGRYRIILQVPGVSWLEP